MAHVLVHRNGGPRMPVYSVDNDETARNSTMVNDANVTSYAQGSIYYEGKWHTARTGSY